MTNTTTTTNSTTTTGQSCPSEWRTIRYKKYTEYQGTKTRRDYYIQYNKQIARYQIMVTVYSSGSAEGEDFTCQTYNAGMSDDYHTLAEAEAALTWGAQEYELQPVTTA